MLLGLAVVGVVAYLLIRNQAVAAGPGALISPGGGLVPAQDHRAIAKSVQQQHNLQNLTNRLPFNIVDGDQVETTSDGGNTASTSATSSSSQSGTPNSAAAS